MAEEDRTNTYGNTRVKEKTRKALMMPVLVMLTFLLTVLLVNLPALSSFLHNQTQIPHFLRTQGRQRAWKNH